MAAVLFLPLTKKQRVIPRLSTVKQFNDMKRKNLSGSSAIQQPFSCSHENGTRISNPLGNVQRLIQKIDKKLPEPLQGMLPAASLFETKLCVTVLLLGTAAMLGLYALLITAIPAFLILTSKEKGASK